MENSKEIKLIEHIATKRYLMALSLIAIMLTTNFWLLQRSISQQENDASLINISGRQRMFSQKMASLTHQLVHADTGLEREQARQSLQEAKNLFLYAHNALTKGNEKLGISPEKSETLNALYFKNHYRLMNRY